jgi:hypothetical protein
MDGEMDTWIKGHFRRRPQLLFAKDTSSNHIYHGDALT